jgi:hypothetical protein
MRQPVTRKQLMQVVGIIYSHPSESELRADFLRLFERLELDGPSSRSSLQKRTSDLRLRQKADAVKPAD